MINGGQFRVMRGLFTVYHYKYFFIFQTAHTLYIVMC